jgi:hypothetical protein
LDPAVVKVDYFFDGVFYTCGILANVFYIWMLIIQSSKGYRIHFWYVDSRHLSNFKKIIRSELSTETKNKYKVILYGFFTSFLIAIISFFLS